MNDYSHIDLLQGWASLLQGCARLGKPPARLGQPPGQHYKSCASLRKLVASFFCKLVASLFCKLAAMDTSQACGKFAASLHCKLADLQMQTCSKLAVLYGNMMIYNLIDIDLVWMGMSCVYPFG
uniref:Uncharacterized protein n=1 Tax=Cacopsylla melanoneura TaxID=428564 RepID=A0A8D8ZIH9_9HEMI